MSTDGSALVPADGVKAGSQNTTGCEVKAG